MQVGDVIGICLPSTQQTEGIPSELPTRELYRDKPMSPCGWTRWSFGAGERVLLKHLKSHNRVETAIGQSPVDQESLYFI